MAARFKVHELDFDCSTRLSAVVHGPGNQFEVETASLHCHAGQLYKSQIRQLREDAHLAHAQKHTHMRR